MWRDQAMARVDSQQKRSAMRVLVALLLASLCWAQAAGSESAGEEEDAASIGADALEILRAEGRNLTGNVTVSELNATVSSEVRKKRNDTNVQIVIKGVEKLLDSLEEDVQKEAGKFNDTIEHQGGVLETVARVGQHVEEESSEKQEEEQTKDEPQNQQKPQTDDGVDSDSDSDSDHFELKSPTNEIQKEFFDHKQQVENRPQENVPEHHESPALQQQQQLNSTSKSVEKKNATTMTKENGRRHQTEDVARLIDRDDNEYVISHPGKKSQMQFQEDLTLIKDIVVVIVASGLGALVFGLLGQPVILGYLAAGMVVGPGGLHLVHELVQVETLAQFGVIFLLFALGVEFSAAKMQGVQAVALGGGCIQILTAMLLGGLLCSSVPQGIFIGAFLSMSSTAVVVKCMMDANMGGTEHGQILLGTLIFQDCALGLLLAVMPALAAKGSSSWTILIALGRECLLLSGFCAVAWILAKLFVPRFLSILTRLSKNSSELYQLGITGLCLYISMVSQGLGLGLEVGAFVAGLMLSGGPYSEKTLHQVEPIRNIFASLFLASIGMVMHPVFLWQHKDILLASLAVMFFGKTFLIAVVVCAFGHSKAISLSVGIALAQIGEFSFVLLSRAQGLGLVSRKLYLLLMGTSAFSLVLTPFAFKLVHRLVPREKKSQYALYTLPVHSYGFLETGDKKQQADGQMKQDDDSVQKSGLSVEGLSKEGDEAARGEKLFPQVTLRRPFSQVFSGQWMGDMPAIYKR